jgi:hypothetical protein
MAERSIKVRKIKETKSRVTIHLMTVNRKMHVAKKDYKARVESGLYDVVNAEPESPEAEDEKTEE